MAEAGQGSWIATFDGKNIQHYGIMQNTDLYTHFCLYYSPVFFTHMYYTALWIHLNT